MAVAEHSGRRKKDREGRTEEGKKGWGGGSWSKCDWLGNHCSGTDKT